VGRGRGYSSGSDRRVDLQPVWCLFSSFLERPLTSLRFCSFLLSAEFILREEALRAKPHRDLPEAARRAAVRMVRMPSKVSFLSSHSQDSEPSLVRSSPPSSRTDPHLPLHRAPHSSASSPSTPSSPPTSVPKSFVTVSPSSSSLPPRQATPPVLSTIPTSPPSFRRSDSTTRMPSNASSSRSDLSLGSRDATLQILLPRRPRALSPRAFGRSSLSITLLEREIKERIWDV